MSTMMNRIFALLLLFAMPFGFAFPTADAQDEADAILRMIQERDREIKAVLGDRETLTGAQREELRELINQGIDFGEMGRTALGPHWEDLAETQQNEFVDVFSRIVREQSLADLDVYRAHVSYDDVTVHNNTARATTSTTYRNVSTTVGYDLIKKDDAWYVTDIIIDNVSTAEGYARSFQNVIRRRGFDALMTSLHQRLERIQTTGA
jgi:phospholipid transport system substrate-binding protein